MLITHPPRVLKPFDYFAYNRLLVFCTSYNYLTIKFQVLYYYHYFTFICRKKTQSRHLFGHVIIGKTKSESYFGILKTETKIIDYDDKL